MATHSFFDTFDTDVPQDISQEEIKFDLYLRTREIRELGDVLRNILLLPVEQRKLWLDQNGDIMTDSLDTFIDQSNFTMHGMQLDDELVELSADLVHSLQDTLTVLRSIVNEHQEIAS